MLSTTDGSATPTMPPPYYRSTWYTFSLLVGTSNSMDWVRRDKYSRENPRVNSIDHDIQVVSRHWLTWLIGVVHKTYLHDSHCLWTKRFYEILKTIIILANF
jgi:hypothetical protein